MNLQAKIEKTRLRAKENIFAKNNSGAAYDDLRHQNMLHDNEILKNMTRTESDNLIPLRYRNKTFDDFKIIYKEQKKIKQIAVYYVNHFPKISNVCFEGLTGTGKTLLVLIILQALVKKDFIIHYEPSLQFLRQLKDKNFESYNAFKSLIKFYESKGLLILDEITVSRVTGDLLTNWEREMLFALIDARYVLGLPIIFISNKSKTEINNILGARIAERLFENSITLAFTWPSFRKV